MPVEPHARITRASATAGGIGEEGVGMQVVLHGTGVARVDADASVDGQHVLGWPGIAHGVGRKVGHVTLVGTFDAEGGHDPRHHGRVRDPQAGPAADTVAGLGTRGGLGAADPAARSWRLRGAIGGGGISHAGGTHQHAHAALITVGDDEGNGGGAIGWLWAGPVDAGAPGSRLSFRGERCRAIRSERARQGRGPCASLDEPTQPEHGRQGGHLHERCSLYPLRHGAERRGISGADISDDYLRAALEQLSCQRTYRRISAWSGESWCETDPGERPGSDHDQKVVAERHIRKG